MEKERGNVGLGRCWKCIARCIAEEEKPKRRKDYSTIKRVWVESSGRAQFAFHRVPHRSANTAGYSADQSMSVRRWFKFIYHTLFRNNVRIISNNHLSCCFNSTRTVWSCIRNYWAKWNDEINFSVIIRAQLPFKTSYLWPREKLLLIFLGERLRPIM